MIQRLVYRQLTQHHDLRDTQRSLAVRGVEGRGEVAEHFAGRPQGFAGVGQWDSVLYFGLARYMASGSWAHVMMCAAGLR